MTRLLRPAFLAIGAIALGLTLPSAAAAQVPGEVMIDGEPLKIWTDAGGRLQVNVDNRRWPDDTFVGEFYSPFSTSGFAGLGLVLEGVNGPAAGSASFGLGSGTMPAPTNGPEVLPTGDPNTQFVATTWDLPDASEPQFRVTQVITYTNGQEQFLTVYGIDNIGETTVSRGRAFVAGDLAIRGSDSGVGIFQDASVAGSRFVGGLNQQVGGTGGFLELTPWSNYQSGPLFEVVNAMQGSGFNDTISSVDTDNAAGVEWDFTSFSPGDSHTFGVAWRFVSTLAITPTVATKQTGNAHTLTAEVADPAGQTAGRGTDVIWEVTGAYESYPVTSNTAGTGRTSFTYIGGAPGDDTVTAFVDQNTNGKRDTSEPQVTANVTWEGPPPPEQGETANARPQGDGTVRVRFPSGAGGASARLAAKRLGVPLSAAQTSFVRLTENTPIPLGSTLDTSDGTVQLLTAGKATKQTGGSPFMSAKFNGGTFTVIQKGRAGVSEMVMRGGQLTACKRPVPQGGARKTTVQAARSGRRLFGNGRGRFRTRGRNSSATVRGTKWLVKDQCRGTTTKVTKGSVLVRDFTRKRTITLKKGKSYLAKAPKKQRRRGGRRGGGRRFG